MTFRALEKKYSIEWSPESSISYLSEWYMDVRDTPLPQLELGSICRALRQNLFVEELIPFAESFLEQDVLAGERYDGELIAALAWLNSNSWAANLCRPYKIYPGVT